MKPKRRDHVARDSKAQSKPQQVKPQAITLSPKHPGPEAPAAPLNPVHMTEPLNIHPEPRKP